MVAVGIMNALLSSIGFSVDAQAASDNIVKIERPGRVPLLYLATIPETVVPKVGAVLFAGSDGVLDLANKGVPQPGSNFLIRSRSLFSLRSIATAAFDPSTDSGPLFDNVRTSQVHAREVEQVLADFKERYGLSEVYLVGTSRGTISAAHLSLYFKDRINGAVLTSTVFSSSRAGSGLAGFNFLQIQVPLLFIHHRRDACKVTPPGGAESMSRRFTVILMDGGDPGNGQECGPYSPHGYLGREREVVDAISDWILSPKQRVNDVR